MIRQMTPLSCHYFAAARQTAWRSFATHSPGEGRHEVRGALWFICLRARHMASASSYCFLPDVGSTHQHRGQLRGLPTDLRADSDPPEGGSTISAWTRKLCYRKDDRAMRPIHGALKIFGTPWLRPRLLFPTFFMGFCSECSFKIWNP